MVDNCNDLSNPEKNLVRHSSLIWKGPKFAFYQLPVAMLDSISMQGTLAFESEMKSIHEGNADTTRILYYDGFESNQNADSFFGSGAFSAEINNWNRIVEQNIKNVQPGDSCEVLFWVKGYEKDLMPRTVIEFVQKTGDQTVDYKYDQFQHYYCSLKDGWMRIKIPFVVQSTNDLVMVTLRNADLKNFSLVVDEIIIRKRP